MVSGIGFSDRQAPVFPVGQWRPSRSTVNRVNAPWRHSGAPPVCPTPGGFCVPFESTQYLATSLRGNPSEDRTLSVRVLRVACRSTHGLTRLRQRTLVDVGGAASR